MIILENEFVTFQRAAAILGENGATVTRVCADRLEERLDKSRAHEETKKNKECTGIRQLVFVSLVNSCTQSIMPVEWVLTVPKDILVALDIAQAVGNIPLDMAALGARPNVFLIRSLIKV